LHLAHALVSAGDDHIASPGYSLVGRGILAGISLGMVLTLVGAFGWASNKSRSEWAYVFFAGVGLIAMGITGVVVHSHRQNASAAPAPSAV